MEYVSLLFTQTILLSATSFTSTWTACTKIDTARLVSFQPRRPVVAMSDLACRNEGQPLHTDMHLAARLCS